MKVNDQGNVEFDPREWVAAMSPGAKLHLLHHLAGDSQIVEAAVGSVMDEWFFDDVAEEEAAGGWWNNMGRQLQAKLIPLMPELAKRLIANLLVELKRAEQDKRRHEEWAWKMYHLWPQDLLGRRPELGDFESAPSWRDKLLDAERMLAEGTHV